MKNLDLTLGEIAEAIQRYESGEWLTVDKLRELLRGLSINRYHLTDINIQLHRDWNTLVYKSKESNAKAKADADYLVPELRQTRKILETINKVLDSIRSEISTINKEH